MYNPKKLQATPWEAIIVATVKFAPETTFYIHNFGDGNYQKKIKVLTLMNIWVEVLPDSSIFAV